MSIREQLTEDLKEAMKSGDDVRKTVIRNIRSVIKENEQSGKEALVKKALEKHGVSRPLKQDNPEELAAYEKAIAAAVEAEKVEEKAVLDEAGVMGVIQKLVKQRQDSIAEAEKANREDIAEAEKEELEILLAYLPVQMSRDEIRAVAQAQIEKTGASDVKEMGKVMGPLMAQLKGKADGKLISEVVKELLG